MPSFDVAAAIMAAKGTGSCLGTCNAWLRDISAVPAQASDTISVSSRII
jgi:hypothetical protein